MSGGSLNYAYQHVDDAADAIQVKSELRKQFVAHLRLVAAALKDIEWVDSCDMGEGDEEAAIRRVFQNIYIDPATPPTDMGDNCTHGSLPCACTPASSGVAPQEPQEEGMITIKKSPTADTRTCDFTKVSRETLLESSIQHVRDVHAGLAFFAGLVTLAAGRHDFDKLSDIEGFHRDFVTGFAQTEWWDRHRQLNRHHLTNSDGVPVDVNLIDVLDFIADCVMAGMARSGTVYDLHLSPELLEAAFQNTVALLKLNVKVAVND
jgi:hypothetical protein